MNLKFNISENKLYSIIISRGLVGYFINFKQLIQTTTDKKNNYLEYYSNLQKKNKEKIYQFKKINNKIVLEGVQFNKGLNYKIINKKDLINVVDPLTAVQKILFSNKLDSNCNIREDIYDGDDVYQVFLTQNRMDYSFINFKNNNYKISFSCRLNYKTVSGHKYKREKKLNSMYLNVFFSKIGNDVIPVYLETTAKLVPLKMYLSTVLRP